MVEDKETKKRLKIAVLIDVLYPYIIGGGQKRVYELYRRLAKKHEVHFFTMRWEGMSEHLFELDGIIVHPICKGSQLYAHGRRKVMPSVKYMLAIIPHLVRNRFDVIDCNEFPFLHIIPTRFLKKDAKLIVSWLEVWKREYWSEYAGHLIGNLGYLIQKTCARFADRIIAISKHTKKDLVEKLNVTDSKIKVIPIGIDINSIKEVKPSKKKSDIMYIGRLIPEKNVDILIKAISIVKREIPKIKCTVVGEGPELDKLMKIKDDLDLKENIEFVKFLPKQEDVISLMKSSKVFATASTREGFGIVIIEAMACGLPIIAVEHPDSAVSELIDNSGVLTELDHEKIAIEITKMMKNKKNRNRMSKNALVNSKRYNWDKIFPMVENEFI